MKPIVQQVVIALKRYKKLLKGQHGLDIHIFTLDYEEDLFKKLKHKV